MFLCHSSTEDSRKLAVLVGQNGGGGQSTTATWHRNNFPGIVTLIRIDYHSTIVLRIFAIIRKNVSVEKALSILKFEEVQPI